MVHIRVDCSKQPCFSWTASSIGKWRARNSPGLYTTNSELKVRLSIRHHWTTGDPERLKLVKQLVWIARWIARAGMVVVILVLVFSLFAQYFLVPQCTVSKIFVQTHLSEPDCPISTGRAYSIPPSSPPKSIDCSPRIHPWEEDFSNLIPVAPDTQIR
jgi:hypothetical protein